MIGQTISHYKILEKLGEGGMGVVYKAHDTKLDRDVALKFLPQDLTKDPEAKERFIHEAKAASALEHSNICNIHEIGETEDGRLFMVMACYEGESLKKKIDKGPLKIDTAIDTAIQVAQGLSKAHEKGIVHRDIKPANIIITVDGVVKILDFGLAKLRGLSKLTKTGSTLGTAPYMSPEQAKGEEVDSKTDIWSLGVMMYEMITGRLPFKGDYEQAITYQIINDTPEPITGLRTGVPVELERIVNKCLEKSPDERYQTAADLIADLKHLQRTTGRLSVQKTAISSAKPSSKKKVIVVTTAIFIIAIGFVLVFKPFSGKSERNRKSIAVLPFKNLSSSKEDEYFSDGIAEDIRTLLGNIAELKVISQQSVLQYKNSNKSVKEIGRELDVATVLEGSVQHAGKLVRINAQLIDASDESHIWADMYDKEETQIFLIQSEVAKKIASVLEAKLSLLEKSQIEKKPTVNLTAYDYYLKGREYYYRYRKQDNETAISLFKKALELDTNYTLALAGLADAYAQRAGNFGLNQVSLDSAMGTATKAISKDEKSSEAYKALGLVYEFQGFYRKAIEAYRKAIECNPNYWPAVGGIGDAYILLGDFVEGMKWKKKAISLNPINAFGNAAIAREYYWLMDSLNGDKYNRRALELQPDLTYIYFNLWFWHLWNGRIQQAINDHEKMFSLDHDTINYEDRSFWLLWYQGDTVQAGKVAYKFAAKGDSGYLPRIYWMEGKKDQARKVFKSRIERGKKVIEQGKDNPWIYFTISRGYAIMEEKTEALNWLRKAIDAGWFFYQEALLGPDMNSIRNDDQFKQMIDEVKTKVDSMRQKVQQMEKEEGND